MNWIVLIIMNVWSVLRLGSRSGSEQLHTLASVKSAMKEHKLRGGAMHAAFKQGTGSLNLQVTFCALNEWLVENIQEKIMVCG